MKISSYIESDFITIHENEKNTHSHKPDELIGTELLQLFKLSCIILAILILYSCFEFWKSYGVILKSHRQHRRYQRAGLSHIDSVDVSHSRVSSIIKHFSQVNTTTLYSSNFVSPLNTLDFDPQLLNTNCLTASL